MRSQLNPSRVQFNVIARNEVGDMRRNSRKALSADPLRSSRQPGGPVSHPFTIHSPASRHGSSPGTATASGCLGADSPAHEDCRCGSRLDVHQLHMTASASTSAHAGDPLTQLGGLLANLDQVHHSRK